MRKMVILAVVFFCTTASTAFAQSPFGFGMAIARRYVGPQIRLASPEAYSALMAVNRSIPPQVKNNFNNSFSPYRGGVNPWSAELNYWRSMPPEVRNNIAKQQRMGYQQQPQVVYVPVPAPLTTPVGTGQPDISAIPVPQPPKQLPRIARQK
ncbi:MAG: hypothetical protein RL518_1146 [Pseudomonadota bacterium]|jgi:hypothetical protein